MQKIDVKKIIDIEKKILSTSNFSSVFLSNGKVYKIFYRDSIVDFYAKLISDKLTGNLIKKRELNVVDAYLLEDFKEIVRPIELIYDKKGFIGYSMEYVEHTDFYDIFLNNQYNYNYLNIVCDQFYKIEQIFKKGHENKIVFPDAFSKGNIVFDKDGKHKLLDLDALQINENFLWQSSSLLGNMQDGILNTERYRTTTELKKEFDHFSLLNSFILCSTFINFATIPYEKNEEVLMKLLWMIGLDKDEIMINEILNAYSIYGKNTYLDDTFKRLSMDYHLEPNHDQPNFKKFVKKR